MAQETKAPSIVLTVALCLAASTLFIAARVYSRFLLKIFRLDDWLLLTAWLFNIALSTITFVDVHFGVGKHTTDILPSQLTPHFKIQYATGVLYYLVLPITKLSICVLYQRVVDVKRTSRILISCLMVYLIVTGLGLTGYETCECIPISAYWNDPFGPQCHRRRTTSNVIFFVNATSNTFTDIALILIVLPVIHKLKLRPRPKLALYSIICLGSLAIAASAIRMIVVSRILKSKDPAWEAADMDIWSCVECNISLICAAAPCIRPSLNKISPRMLPSYFRNRTRMGQSSYGVAGDVDVDVDVSWELRQTHNDTGKNGLSVSETALANVDTE